MALPEYVPSSLLPYTAYCRYSLLIPLHCQLTIFPAVSIRLTGIRIKYIAGTYTVLQENRD